MRWLLLVASLLPVACRRGQAAPVPAAASDEERAAFARLRRPDLVVRGLELRPGLRVADVGAGTGLLTRYLAAAVAPGGRVVATDVDAAALAAIDVPGVMTRVVAADDPGLERGAYDRILVADVDQYLPDRAAWLGRAATALAAGGFIAVSNRLAYRADVVAAAARAGLAVRAEPLALPGRFFLRLEPRP